MKGLGADEMEGQNPKAGIILMLTKKTLDVARNARRNSRREKGMRGGIMINIRKRKDWDRL